MFERDEMKTCPHCETVMEEKAGSGGEVLKIPQQLADDQPPLMKATRVRWNCPKCNHVEEGYPGAHAAWDKSDPPQT
jgi:DNA-directed RNA polymerase subunit M/transcription elongation factor TFIIS